MQLLSMGYGFVEYKKAASVDKALKTLQVWNYVTITDSLSKLVFFI